MDIKFSDRIDNLIRCPFRVGKAVISGTEDIVVGVTGVALYAITMGNNKTFEDMADKLENTYKMLPRVFKSILKVVKPHYPIADNLNEYGWLSDKCIVFLFDKSEVYARNKDSFIKSHFFSRGTAALLLIVGPITRTADLALGLVAASFSILTLGNVERINTFAMQQLTFFGLAEDICFSLSLLVNPT